MFAKEAHSNRRRKVFIPVCPAFVNEIPCAPLFSYPRGARGHALFKLLGIA